jgi:hypothetical protein
MSKLNNAVLPAPPGGAPVSLGFFREPAANRNWSHISQRHAPAKVISAIKVGAR